MNSPLKMLYASLWTGYENLGLDQDNNIYLISLSILVTCLLEIVRIL